MNEFNEIAPFNADDETIWEVYPKGITDEDIISILRLGSTSRIYKVWEYKIGQYPKEVYEQEDGALMRSTNRHLMKMMKEVFEEREGKELVEAGIIQHHRIPYFITPIGYFVDGEDAGVLCTWWNSDEAAETFGSEVQGPKDENDIRCQWNMFITGYDYWYSVEMYDFRRIEIRVVERDEDTIEMLKETAEKFWEHNVKAKKPPEVNGSISCFRALNRFFKGGLKRKYEISDEYEPLCKEILDLRMKIYREKQELESKISQMKLVLQQHEYASCGRFYIEWPEIVRKKLNTKRLGDDFPELVEKYKEKTTHREFYVKTYRSKRKGNEKWTRDSNW